MKYNPTLYKLSNGITVILDPMGCEITDVMVHFSTGSRDESPEQYGITHFCEHMFCKGTQRFPTSKDIKEFIEYNGGYSNASTSPSDLKFYGRIIGENLDKLIELLSDELQNSLFDSNRIELERIVILDELRRAQDKGTRVYSDFMSRKLFGYSGFQTLGTEQNIKSFTRKQLMDWAAKRLSAKNCTIVISGKISHPDKVLKQLEAGFAFLPTHNVSCNKEEKYTPAIAHQSISQLKSETLDILIPCRFGPEKSHMLERMCELRLKKYLRDELHEELRQKHGLVYSVSTGLFGRQEKGLHTIGTECSVQYLPKIVELIAKTCARINSDMPITDEWLRRFEASCLLGDAEWFDSSKNRLGALLHEYVQNGELYDRDAVIKTSRGITSADIRKYASGIFDEPISIITHGPDYDADLGEIWKQNFPDSNIKPAISQYKIETARKKTGNEGKDKCR